MTITNDKKHYSKQITERFLVAMDRIMGNRENGKVTAKSFGEVIGIPASNLVRIRKSPDENAVSLEAIGRLCHNYKISASWLITGEGNMYGSTDVTETLDHRLRKLEVTLNNVLKEVRRENV